MSFGSLPRYPLVILLAMVLFYGLAACYFRAPAYDEASYLNDALGMARTLKEGRWIGGGDTGFHGFLFKLPAALLFLLFGPSVFAATLTTLIFSLLAVYLSFLVFQNLLKYPQWALVGSFLVFTSIFFLRVTPTFLRDSPALCTLLLFLHLNLEKKNPWLLGLALLLILDAKESVFFSILPGYLLWLVYDRFLKNREPFPGRLVPLFLPSSVFLFLMFATNLIPLNPVTANILGLNQGGLNSIGEIFATHRTTRNTQAGDSRDLPYPGPNRYGWTASEGGKVILMPETLTKDKLPVVKLVKPPQPSRHRTSHYIHYCRYLMKPVPCRKGDVLLYSIRYKTASPKTVNLWAINILSGENRCTGMKKIILEKDGNWHLVKINVPVSENGIVRPEFRWPAARDMSLLVAGYRCEKLPVKPISYSALNAAAPVQASAGAGLTGLWEKLQAIFNIVLLYLGKIFYSRTFSFTSMPRFIFLPALVMSVVLFRLWLKQGKAEKLILPLMLWGYLAIYILRTSSGRRLLPMVPLIMLFFIFFLRDGLKEKRLARNTLIATAAFTAIGLLFEVKYPLIKLILNLVFLSLLGLIFYLQHHPRYNRSLNPAKMIFIGLIAAAAFLAHLGTSYAQPRQLGRFLTWGSMSQMDLIAAQFNSQEKTWINHDPRLVRFFRRDGARPLPFRQSYWRLKEWLPKANMMETIQQLRTFSFSWNTGKGFKKQLQEKDIRKVALVVSTHKSAKYRFPLQDRLPLLLNMPFLKLAKKMDLKNKIVYLFNVNPNHE